MSNLSRIRLRRVWLPLFVALMAANIGTLAQAQTSSPLRLLQSDANRVVVELAVPSYAARQQTVDGAPFTVLSLPDFGHSDTPGEPQLPTKGTLIGVPPGAEPSLRVLDDDATTTTIAFPPLPAPTTLAQFDPNQLLPAYGGKVFAPNAATYSADRFMPADAAQLRAVGNWRSQRYALLQFAPLQYNPASHQLIFHRRLRVEITFAYPRGKTPTALGAPLDEGAFEPILQHALLNYDSAKNWRARDMPQPQLPQQSSVSTSGGPWYKIAIADDGIYQLACQQLADAGINVATLNVSTLKIFKQGVELAIQVVGAWSGTCSANDLIVFFAQAARTRYTNTNIYWLTFDGAPGKRMVTRDGSGVGATPTVFTESVHLENDRQYIQSPVLNETDDKWYWFNMPNAYDPDGNGDANSADFGIHLDGVASGAWAATLDVRLFGFQSAAHHTQVFVNNNVIGDFNWYGIATSDTALSFPQAYLNPITNTIRISEELGVIFVNNFDIGYARTFTATNDALRFRQTTNGAWRYQISGFVAPSITAFDITDPYNVTRIVNASVAPSGGTYSLSFDDALPTPREYIALADAQRKTPLSVTADVPSSLASASNGADYIIISYGGFIPNAMPLANFRAAQGLRVKVVDAQDVYDEFSDGLMDAQAVHNFLQYAYTNWQAPAPSFVLLVGDGNFDFKNNYGTGEPNFIPPYLLKVDPWIGETASDNRFVAFNLTNTLPSMAIGRLPADNAADVDAMVSKILNYEQNPPPGLWRTTAAFVADNPDDAGDFWQLSDAVAGDPRYMPPPLRADRIYYGTVNYATTASVRTGIVNAINDGRVIVNYIGHGANQYWATERLLRLTEVNALANGGKQPVVLALTCLDGFFHQPGAPSIAESNVRLPGRGALASWSASGFGVATGHDYLDRGFFDAVVNQRVYRLGPATLAGKMNLWLNGGGGNLDLLDTFNLLGDPASRLAILPSAIYLPLMTR